MGRNRRALSVRDVVPQPLIGVQIAMQWNHGQLLAVNDRNLLSGRQFMGEQQATLASIRTRDAH